MSDYEPSSSEYKPSESTMRIIKNDEELEMSEMDSKREPLLGAHKEESLLLKKRIYVDLPFIYALAVPFVFILVLSIVSSFVYKDFSNLEPIKGYFYYTISQSIVQILYLGVSFSIIGILWSYSLFRYSNVTLWCTVYSSSIFFLLAAIQLFYFSSKPTSSRIIFIIEGILLVSLSFLSFKFGSIYRKTPPNNSNASNTANVASKVLLENQSLFIIFFGLATFYLIYAITWVYLFSKLFLMGKLEEDDGEHFEMSTFSLFSVALAAFSFFWTSNTITNFNVCIISSVTYSWYTNRNSKTYKSGKHVLQSLLNIPTSTGPVSLWSLIQLFLSFLYSFSFALEKFGDKYSFMKRPSVWIAEKSMKVKRRANRFSLIFSAITGENFEESTKKISERLGDFTASTIDSTIETSLAFFNLSLSIIFGIALMNDSNYEGSWIPVLLGVFVCNYIVSIYSQIAIFTLESLFICHYMGFPSDNEHENRFIQDYFNQIGLRPDLENSAQMSERSQDNEEIENESDNVEEVTDEEQNLKQKEVEDSILN